MCQCDIVTLETGKLVSMDLLHLCNITNYFLCPLNTLPRVTVVRLNYFIRHVIINLLDFRTDQSSVSNVQGVKENKYRDYARSILHPRFNGERCKQGVAKLIVTGFLMVKFFL